MTSRWPRTTTMRARSRSRSRSARGAAAGMPVGGVAGDRRAIPGPAGRSAVPTTGQDRVHPFAASSSSPSGWVSRCSSSSCSPSGSSSGPTRSGTGASVTKACSGRRLGVQVGTLRRRRGARPPAAARQSLARWPPGAAGGRPGRQRIGARLARSPERRRSRVRAAVRAESRRDPRPARGPGSGRRHTVRPARRHADGAAGDRRRGPCPSP